MIEEINRKAEEYMYKHWSCNVIEMNSQRTFQQVKGTPHFYEKNIKQAYIEGATENGVYWHDLRKDSNDLPKKNKSYWVYMDCQGNKIYRSVVWQGCWLGWNGGIPLAWCEEPQFKE